MFSFVDPDDLVHKLHQLKNIEPSPGMTVRVEDYGGVSKLFNDGTIFVWDDKVSPPRSDTEFMKASKVEGYRPGDANEGVWMVLGVTAPADKGLVVARPSSGAARSFAPSLYDSSDAAIDAATTYCNSQGGGVVRVPTTLLPVDYFTVSVAASVELVVEQASRLTKINDTDSPYSATKPATIFADTSSAGVTVSLAEELEVSGTEVRIRRGGANAVTIETGTDATVNGSTSQTISTDGNVVALIYDRSNDNWLTIATN